MTVSIAQIYPEPQPPRLPVCGKCHKPGKLFALRGFDCYFCQTCGEEVIAALDAAEREFNNERAYRGPRQW